MRRKISSLLASASARDKLGSQSIAGARQTINGGGGVAFSPSRRMPMNFRNILNATQSLLKDFYSERVSFS